MKIIVLDATRSFDRACELCGKVDDCRPYGPGGKWICYECGEKMPKVVEREMAKRFDKGDPRLGDIVERKDQ